MTKTFLDYKKNQDENDFDTLLRTYDNTIKVVEKTQSKLKKDDVLELLLARDHLENAFSDKKNIEKNDIGRLFLIDQRVSEMDDRLRKLGSQIAATISLDKWRSRLQANDKQWWWFFEPPKKVNSWDRVDWLWDALTLGSLALAASFMVSIISALSVGSLTVASTLSTIAQVGGLAIVSQGALTKTGQRKVQDILAKFTIPPRFHSEAIFFMSMILLSTVYLTHQSLNGQYLDKGRLAYENGQLREAELTFLRGLEIEPDNSVFNANLGSIYESLGILDKAVAQYYLNVQAGGIKGINDLGRTYINWPASKKNDPSLAEAYLFLALHRVEVTDETILNPVELRELRDIKYQVNRNLGWSLLKQRKFEDAKEYLIKAVEIDEGITENQIGGGMAYCFLAHVYDNQNNPEMARPQWRNCMIKARPETIHEFKWFIDIRKDELASCINTSKIVSGLNEFVFDNKMTSNCQTVLAKLTPEFLNAAK